MILLNYILILIFISNLSCVQPIEASTLKTSSDLEIDILATKDAQVSNLSPNINYGSVEEMDCGNSGASKNLVYIHFNLKISKNWDDVYLLFTANFTPSKDFMSIIKGFGMIR